MLRPRGLVLREDGGGRVRVDAGGVAEVGNAVRAEAAFLEIGVRLLEPAGVGQVIQPDAGGLVRVDAGAQVGFGLVQKPLLGQADALHQAPVADGLAVHADGNQIGMFGEVGAEGLELHAGVNAVGRARLERGLVKHVKPRRVGPMRRKLVDVLDGGAAVGPDEG
ncbi:MAG: hypothetical protein H6644_06020 [Caldilineaceae bacterium]|nr:hypothetical protein [Caldilineaceae bacterium]